MKCPHCGISFHANWDDNSFVRFNRYVGSWIYRSCHCPECDKFSIEFKNAEGKEVPEWKLVHPSGANRGPIPKSVPQNIASDYAEAASVILISSKASAALSRRCLQNMLRANGYKAKDLAKEIDAFLGETDASKSAPQSLKDVVDGIRNFGNFSAHPINDVTSLQIIDVEPAEAEWCLEILEEMFQHFYERPAQASARKAALNAKLAAAGKPPAK